MLKNESSPQKEDISKCESAEQASQTQNVEHKGEILMNHACSQGKVANEQKTDSSGIQENPIDSGKFDNPPEKAEKPKTANEAFGSISDFLLFFENRNPKIKDFAKKFQEIETLNGELAISELNTIIIPQIKECLNEEFKKSDEYKKPEDKRQNKYAELFTKPFKTWEEFYKQVLHAYTINGFLYLHMNKYLRNEDWMELDTLLPYTYSLFKAFLWGPTGLTVQGNFETLKAKAEGNILTLYRGLDFDDDSLSFYDEKKVKNFSWNGVTSTSLLRSVAERFSQYASKIPVLITIEIDLEGLKPENLNGLYLAKISKCPSEEEVALAPGSIFELLDIKKENGKVEMRLKLVTDAKVLAHQGQFMHGMLQTVMRREKELKIVCLNGDDLSRSIRHCKGNLLLESFEFSLCNFDQQTAEILLEILPSIKYLKCFAFNLTMLDFSCNLLLKIIECLGRMKIKQLEILISLHQDDQVKSLIESMQYLSSLSKLKVTFVQSYPIDGGLIKELYSASVKYLNPECLFEVKVQDNLSIVTKQGNRYHFNKDFEKVLNSQYPSKQRKISSLKVLNGLNVEEQEIERIFTILQIKKPIIKDSNLKTEQIKSLSLAFNSSKIIPHLSLASYDLESLTHLNLCFCGCSEVSNEDLKSLWNKGGIGNLHSLTSLSLDFSSCKKLPSEGFNHFQKIQNLRFLTALNISFDGCSQMTDGSLEFLHGIGNILSLTILHMDFNSCEKITDQGFSYLQNIKNFKALETLHLDFGGCLEMTDRSLEFLKGIEDFKSLKILNLNFDSCEKITEKGIEFLQRISKIKSLTTLHLDFDACEQIPAKGFNFLRCIPDLTSLTVLILNFGGCLEMKDKNLEFLEQIKDLKTLSSLELNFDSCQEISEKGFDYLKHLQDLNSLTSLSLNFDSCNIKELDFLRKIEGLESLTALHLDFARCKKITDKSLEFLKIIKELKLLTSLYLNFDSCDKITDQGFNYLRNLYEIKSLTSLHLSFSRCVQMTDKSLEFLQEIEYLKFLNTLHLNFDFCCKITDDTLKENCGGILHLKELKILSLSFYRCIGLTQAEIDNFERDISSRIPSLVSFNLDFDGKEKPKNTSTALKIQNCHSFIKEWQSCDSENPLAISVICQDKPTLSVQKANSEEVPMYFCRLEDFGKLKRLKTLQFRFCEKEEISSLHIENLAFHLMKHFWTLTSLHLDLSGCGGITDKGFQILFDKGVRSLRSLTNLQINCDSCFEITDKGLESLGRNGTKGLKLLLTNLFLSFNGCSRITDEGVQILFSQGMKDLKSLTNLHISFDGCSQITRKELDSLREEKVKEALKSLTTFYLNLNGCDKIVNEDLEVLCEEGIYDLKFLKNLFLCIPSAGIIEELESKTLKFESLLTCAVFVKNRIGKRNIEGFNLKRSNLNIKAENLSDKKTTANVICVKKPTFSFGDKSHILDEKTLEILGFAPVQNKEAENNKSLQFTFNQCEDIIGHLHQSIFSTNKRYLLKSLLKLTLRFDQCPDITDKGLRSLATKGIQPLKTTLQVLQLTFYKCDQITDQGLEILFWEGIRDLKEGLRALNLNFGGCDRVTDEKFMDFYKKVDHHFSDLKGSQTSSKSLKLSPNQPLSSVEVENISVACFDQLWFYPSDAPLNVEENLIDCLKRNSSELNEILQNQDLPDCLILKFKDPSKITDDDLYKFILEEDPLLIQLKTLHFIFDDCKRMTGELLESKSFYCRIIQSLQSLTTLSLSFNNCSGITGQGIKKLFFEGISQSKSLRKLHLSFQKCQEITEKGLNNLCQGIKELTALETFCVNLDGCHQISDEGLEILRSEGLQNFSSLKEFGLILKGCQNITDKGLKNLCHNWIENLKGLEILYLDFTGCNLILNEGLKNLGSVGIQPLKLLKKLYLSFKQCQNITNEGLKNLCQGIKNLRLLEQLDLNFDGCNEISDGGIKALCFEGVKYLEFLTRLTLIFKGCQKITDRGIKILRQEGLSRLKRLEMLNLNFGDSNQITDVGFQDLCQSGISQLNSLKSLDLNFNGLSDEGLYCLCCETIKNLDDLASLKFIFKNGDKITDQGLKALILEGMPRMLKLENLQLSLPQALKVSINIYQTILRILFYFGFESSSDLR